MNDTFGIILYYIITFSWIIYILQESFITGASALNMSISKNEAERKQIQVTSGLHFDGIEVWLVGVMTLFLGAFPLAFATVLEFLYIPFFLLLYALIARGVSIEVIYKMDSKRWIKTMVVAWTVSSILIMFILGVYLTNMFLGFSLVQVDEVFTMQDTFMSIFNVTGISGGLMFVAISLITGAGWIYLTTEGKIGIKAIAFVKKIGVIYTIPVLLLLTFMGLNNQDTSIFIGELFTKSFLFFLFPLLTVISAIITTYVGYLENGKKMFIYGLITLGLFLLTGFLGNYPYMVSSTISFESGMDIFESMANADSLLIIIIAVAIFYPIIAFYQSWKYRKFTTKIKLNDE